MCFGVRDALETMRTLPHPDRVTVHGQLVHNPVVTDELDRRGFLQQSEHERQNALPQTPEVLITAHGVSHKVRNHLQKEGYKLHDTTCPLVRRAHKAALHYHNSGFFMVVVGREGHVEVEGLVGDLQNFTVVSELDQVRTYDAPKVAVVNQTTTRPDDLKLFHERVRALNPDREVVLVDTTCKPTRERQDSVTELLERVQALVVVGGANSNNTLQLGLKAQEKGLPWWRVADAGELRQEWFRNLRVVGLTAGTSTTDETVKEVARRLRSFRAALLSA
jgi:4-hydroxy-3-methylbut-2-enyl diphosphate reductase